LHNDKQHLFSLSYISRLVMDQDVLKRLTEAADATEIHQLLTVIPEQTNK